MRRLEVELVGPEPDARRADEIAHRFDQARVVDEAIEDRIERVERLDHAQRRGAGPVFELHRDGAGVDVAIAVHLVGAALDGESQRELAHAIGGGAHLVDLARVEDGAAHEEAVLPPGAPLGLGEREARRHQPSLASAASISRRSSS